MSDDDRRKRAITAGLSATGAAAGAAGLGYAGHKTSQAYRNARALGARGYGPPGRRGALVSAIKHEKFGAALVPLEVAGLGGELMATKILHADAKKMPKKEPVVVKNLGIAQSNGHGRRIVEEPVAKAAPTAVVRAATKAGVLVPKPKPVEGVKQLKRRYTASLQDELDRKLGTVVTSKARRFDPEADRQRRLGMYGGLAGGGALIAGERFGREVRGGAIEHGGKRIRAVGLRRGKVGAAYGAAALGLAGLSAASVKRGISERNQTWT